MFYCIVFGSAVLCFIVFLCSAVLCFIVFLVVQSCFIVLFASPVVKCYCFFTGTLFSLVFASVECYW